MQQKHSIWFFIGVLLLVYGVAICFTGFWELKYPLAQPPVLVQLHAPIWWGAILGLVGAVFVYRCAQKMP
jgi:hypothetical protein